MVTENTAAHHCPTSVERAVFLSWALLAVSSVAALANRLLGVFGNGQFAATLILYGLCAIFPYKLARGSNATRIVFAVLSVGSWLYAVGTGFAGSTKLDMVLGVALLPLDIYVLYCLFSNEANRWFSLQR
jgi:hypothetical protein